MLGDGARPGPCQQRAGGAGPGQGQHPRPHRREQHTGSRPGHIDLGPVRHQIAARVRRLVGQQRQQGVEVLDHVAVGPAPLQPEHLGHDRLVAHPDAEREPPAADLVDGAGLLGEVLGQRRLDGDHAGGQLDGGNPVGHDGQHRDRVGPLDLGHHVAVQPSGLGPARIGHRRIHPGRQVKQRILHGHAPITSSPRLPTPKQRSGAACDFRLRSTAQSARAVTFVSRYGAVMSELTGAERYLENRREDPAYDLAYIAARHRIDQIDAIIRALDQRRSNLKLSKAELARRADLRPEVIRRLFSAESPNPTLSTVVALAGALELEMTAEPLEDSRAVGGQPR